MQPTAKALAIGLSALVIAVGGCGETAKLQEQASTGPRPLLPEPNQTLIPTVLIATPKGWSNDAKPRPASELSVSPYTASLGLTFSGGTLLPKTFRNGAFIGQHGSWNRKPRAGYKVVFVPFADGRPSGQPADVLTGFVNEAGDALGRPVGVAIDRPGALLVADDVGNTIWRVTPAAQNTAMAR
jgi:glucose/arabinose dehydrogenase